MKKKMESYKRYIFIGMIIIALGVNLSTVFSESTASLGTVLIAVGGLFFIRGMSLKKERT
jgi:uncharacterized membrane protein